MTEQRGHPIGAPVSTLTHRPRCAGRGHRNRHAGAGSIAASISVAPTGGTNIPVITDISCKARDRGASSPRIYPAGNENKRGLT